MSPESSDEENLEFLREATDSSFINDSMFKEKPEKTDTCSEKATQAEIEQLPSLRKTKEDDQFNVFHVTPEFQEFVAKRLSKTIEANIKSQETNLNLNNCERVVDKVKKKRKSKNRKELKHIGVNKGVKLFKDSKTFLDINCNDEERLYHLMTNQHNQTKPCRNPKLQYTEVSKEVLEQVAVDPETILSGRETLCWSNRSKAKNFFRYKKNKKGDLELIEPEFV